MILRIGAHPTAEEHYAAALVAQIDRIGSPAARRGYFGALWDAYGAAVPRRRTRVLRALLDEAESAEAAERAESAGDDFAAWPLVVRPG